MGFHPVEIDVLKSLGGKRVLEVGCGKGYTAEQLAEIFPQPVGIEPSLSALFDPGAQETFSKVSSFYVCAACGEGLPFENETFDGAVSHWAVHHYRFPVQVFAEVLRVLKPGGWLYVADGVRVSEDMVTTKQRAHYLFHEAAIAVDMKNRIHHFPIYDADSVAGIVRRAGFSVKKVTIITEENPWDESLESEYISTYIRRLEALKPAAREDKKLLEKIQNAIDYIRHNGIKMSPFVMVVAKKNEE